MVKTEEDIAISAIFEWVCRWYVWVFMMIYGIGKILGGQFYRKGQLPTDIANKTLEDASLFEIAWTFMGSAPAYILFVGICQVVGASLLLWNRSKLLGVILLTPILVNIIVFDLIFMEFKGPVANATIYQMMLFYILYFNKERVIAAWKSLTHVSDYQHYPLRWSWHYTIIAIVLAVVIFMVDQSLVSLIGRGNK